jgi:TatD DNase family protein
VPGPDRAVLRPDRAVHAGGTTRGSSYVEAVIDTTAAGPAADPAARRDDDPSRGVDGPWIDNHCHIAAEADLAEVVDAAAEAGVVAMICVGTDAASSVACLEAASADARVWATAGVHPHDAVQGTDELRQVIDAGLPGGRLVAIGECGLDYHYDHSPRATQREVFAEQVRLAHELDLPLVIHTRDAWDDTFEILVAETVPTRTVFHCFTGGTQEAARCLELGALLSISGIVTFPSAKELRAAVAEAPLERLMVETDSPYLTPVPHRGTRNRPAFVGLVGAEVAELHGRPVHEVAARTTATASAFYGLDAS